MAKSQARAISDDPAPTPAASACAAADAMSRAAGECARQHERLGRCLEQSCSDAELLRIAQFANLADTHLDVTVAEYEESATAAPEAKSTNWWHAANGLWLAGRELRRRHAGTDHVSRFSSRHTREKLGELALEFELERSALMALKQAVQTYNALRQESESA
jgi:hypothetical protein